MRDEGVGSVGEEAAKLLGALQDWAKETSSAPHGHLGEDLDRQVRDVGAHLGQSEDCRYCPVCQVIRMLRETSPDIRQHLATAASSLAQAVSLYLNPPASEPPEEPASKTSIIDLDDD